MLGQEATELREKNSRTEMVQGIYWVRVRAFVEEKDGEWLFMADEAAAVLLGQHLFHRLIGDPCS